ncbi:hypothetical protein AXG93_2145s1630 [Marchantia polymorpha subsp. ruderalis]|uniref:Uncharacterized protein n=1 Tax=Marchantia polymorpha subsp. ruderalis TaxID=1480154 RepID=A0A176VYI6_MARPO|nr:hypothetical protein AXG93_2145s1630 [Marchantia polymorpha subsp. ruderalis]
MRAVAIWDCTDDPGVGCLASGSRGLALKSIGSNPARDGTGVDRTPGTLPGLRRHGRTRTLSRSSRRSEREETRTWRLLKFFNYAGWPRRKELELDKQTGDCSVCLLTPLFFRLTEDNQRWTSRRSELQSRRKNEVAVWLPYGTSNGVLSARRLLQSSELLEGKRVRAEAGRSPPLGELCDQAGFEERRPL